METEDAYDLDLDEEEPEPVQETPPEEEAPAEGAPAPTDDAKFDALKAQIAELSGKASVSDDLKGLVTLGQEFLKRQSAPAPAAPDHEAGKRQLAEFGRKFQELALAGDHDALGTFFISAVNDVAQSQVNAALQQHGQPLANKAGAMALRSFIADKRDAAPQGDKLHPLIAKEFSLTPQQKAWLATAADEHAQAFLEDRWEAAAGKVLLKSASRAKPRDIGGGRGAAGGAAGDNVTAFPGVDARDQRRIDRLAEQFWPDPKVRAAKMKAMRMEMEA